LPNQILFLVLVDGADELGSEPALKGQHLLLADCQR
jgi:hypothetical protein